MGGRLVEKHERPRFHEGARKRQTLPLAHRQADPAVADSRVPTVGQTGHDVVETRDGRRPFELASEGAAHVLEHGPGKDRGPLGNPRDLPPQAFLRDAFDRRAPDPRASRRRMDKP